MAELVAEFKGVIAKLGGQAKQFRTEAQTTLKKCKTALKQLESYKPQPPSLKNKGWSKEAEKLGADKKIVAALKKAESTGTRASCVAAQKALKGEKKLKDMDKELLGILQKDAAAAKKIAGIRSKVEPQLSAAKSLAATVKQFEARLQKIQGELDGLETDMKKEKQAAEMQASARS